MDTMYKWSDCEGFSASVMFGSRTENIRFEIIDELKNKIRIYIKNNQFGDYYSSMDIPETLNIQGYLVIDDGEYTVSEVFLNCKEWNIILPKTVEWVAIYDDRNESGYFSVDENNPYLVSERGSLYSKEGQLLYYHIGRDIDYAATLTIKENTNRIMPNAIQSTKRLTLVIPESCNEIELLKGSIKGTFDCIDFKGGIRSIEADALNGIECEDLRINCLLSDIEEEGQRELKRWFDRRDYRKVRRLYLAVPMAKDSKALENGYIKLTGVLSINERLNRIDIEEQDKDSSPLYINSYINERFCELGVAVPIVIDTVVLSDSSVDGYIYYPYTPVTVTRIVFVSPGGEKANEANHYSVLVYESEERVRNLIQDSFTKA